MNLIIYPDGSAQHVPTHLCDGNGCVDHPQSRIGLVLNALFHPANNPPAQPFVAPYLDVYTLRHR